MRFRERASAWALMGPLVLVLVGGADAPPGDVWPGFRGDGGSRSQARDLPLRWSAGENLAWKAALPGYGQSSPVVWKGRVYLTAVEGRDKEKCLVVALDAADGRKVWGRDFPASQKGRNAPTVSRAAPTPAADGRGVYAFFESGDLVALDPDGKTRWWRSLTKEFGPFDNNHGLAASPAQSDDALFVLVDHRGPSYLLAVEKSTGQTRWKAERAARPSWASPVVVTLGGRTLVLVSSGGTLDAYDATDGDRLWSLGGLTGNSLPSATVAGAYVLVGAGESRAATDPEGTAKSNCCVRLVDKGGVPGYEVAWRGRKAVAHHASPLAHAGHAYVVTKAGVVHCLDLGTGEERYAERLDNPCWATPVAAGKYVYFFGKDGATTVIEAGPAWKKVATNRLWSADVAKARKDAEAKKPENQPRFGPPSGARPEGAPGGPRAGGRPAGAPDPEAARLATYEALGDVVYGAAVVNGTLYLRTGTELYCVRAGATTGTSLR